MASEAFERWWPNLTGDGRSVGERAWTAAVEACAAEAIERSRACKLAAEELPPSSAERFAKSGGALELYYLAARLRRLA